MDHFLWIRRAQTRQTFRNIADTLSEVGSELESDMVEITSYQIAWPARQTSCSPWRPSSSNAVSGLDRRGDHGTLRG